MDIRLGPLVLPLSLGERSHRRLYAEESTLENSTSVPNSPDLTASAHQHKTVCDPQLGLQISTEAQGARTERLTGSTTV